MHVAWLTEKTHSACSMAHREDTVHIAGLIDTEHIGQLTEKTHSTYIARLTERTPDTAR